MSLQTDDPSFQAGREMRRKLMGDAGVARLDAADEFYAPLENFVTKAVFGDTWTREGLALRERLLITLGIVAALGKELPVRRLTRLALTNGCTKEDVRETLLQATMYAGVASGVEAWEWAAETLKEMDAY
jgi:4-carboxymuconolactone decarboxylase